MYDLSILIPSRNEMFLKQTIGNILRNKRGRTEIIAVCDGSWPDPPVEDCPDVTLIHHTEPIGQRAATNEAARYSKSQFVMKCDAHCAFDEGFDVKLMADCEDDWTVIPRMYNLHAFDWKCVQCGYRTYQGPKPEKCGKCGSLEHEIFVVWEPRWRRKTDSMRFDNELIFQYWGAYTQRPEAQSEICDTMSSLGACFFMKRERYWDLEGLDEKHGSWGQVGTELACKTWLSGGRQVVNKKTWYAHMFRTQNGFTFPYPISGNQQNRARKYSRDLWMNNKWPKQKYPLNWLVNKFAPVPTWDDIEENPTAGIVYYTNNNLNPKIMSVVQKKLNEVGLPIVSVSLEPLDFGKNIVMDLKSGHLTMFRQILRGLEAINTDVVFMAEHDVIYHPSHYDFIPPRKDVYYYNYNVWKVNAENGQALFYLTGQTSGLVAYRDLLLEHYRKRVERVEKEGRYSRNMGFEPGYHQPPRGIDNYTAGQYMSTWPNIDVRHDRNLTKNRWSRDQFRSQKNCQGWTMADGVPFWGEIKGRFEEFIASL